MANPVDFPGSNKTLVAPKGQEGFIQPMRIFSNGVVCVSCWELSREDCLEVLKRMLAGGKDETLKLYISVFSGPTQPPIFLGSEDQVRSVIADFGGVWKK